MKTFARSVCAGAAIGLGGTVFLAVDDKVAGAFLFAVGLMTVLVFGFDLFTGKACNADYLKKPLTLCTIWLGNLVGAVAFGLLAATHTNLLQKAAGIIELKAAKPVYLLLIDGIICEFCIAIAVRGYAKAEGFAKTLLVILGVMVFILCGAEHVVADMFYLAASLSTNILDIAKIICFATLGNLLGAVIWIFAEKTVSKA